MNALIVSALIAANVVINVTGTYLLKVAATGGNPVAGIIGCGCYIFAASLFVLVVKEQPLAAVAVVTSVLSLVVVSIIGVVVFKEMLAPIHYAGIAFAVIAVVLISMPGAAR